MPTIDLSKAQPSDLILLALDDLAKCEGDDNYEVVMGTWHQPSGYWDGVCTVCLAGAVMVKTLKALPEKYLTPFDFSRSNSAALHALNCFRVGAVHAGLGLLGIDPRKYPLEDREIIVYPEISP